MAIGGPFDCVLKPYGDPLYYEAGTGKPVYYDRKDSMIDNSHKGFDSYTNSSIGDEPLKEVVSKFEKKYKTWHMRLSLTKSGIRLLGCFVAIAYSNMNPLFAVLSLAFAFMIAECIGIIEEL